MRSGFHLPELSLRVRLVAVLVVLAAVGLTTLALVSYRELESYLLDRVDQQVESAVVPVSMQLFDKLEPGAFPAAGERGGIGPPPSQGSQLPPGTYGELRAADGEVLARVTLKTLSYSEEKPALPALPDEVEAGTRGDPAAPVTVGERGGGSASFRALAVAGPAGTVTVVAVPMSETEATLDRLATIALIVSAAILALLALAAWWLVGVGLLPLRRMGEVAGDIAAGDLSRRVEPANEKTEVGRLGMALNGMLAQIEGAFAKREESEARLRQFLADASHELRTPLAAIRGYAELHRLGAAREPDQVDRAMDRIESEATRMTGLVEDLFTLARVDEVREPVHDRVELAELVGEAGEDARATAPARAIGVDLVDSAVVEGNADELRRVFVNLLANAVIHTPAETPIELSLRREESDGPAGGEAVVRVRDHGPGLPQGDPQTVFERFWRGSASRGRDDGGAGPGLAIVAAIVGSHGGTVSAANAPGGGAEFTVRLPLAPY